MADPYLNRALTTFRNEVNVRYPNRDKASDGWIGDPAHQATSSDHNPDPAGQVDAGSVDAWDMDVELNGTGKPYKEDLWVVINAALKHEAIQYVIYDSRITSRTWGLGVWRAYDGPNPHDKHVHFNTRESHETSTKPWLPPKEEKPMNADDFLKILSDSRVSAKLAALAVTYPIYSGQSLLNHYIEEDSQTDSIASKVVSTEAKVDALTKAVATLTATLTELANRPAPVGTVDITAIAKAVADENYRRQAE